MPKDTLPSQWKANLPRQPAKGYRCGARYITGTWGSLGCDSENNFVCEQHLGEYDNMPGGNEYTLDSGYLKH